MAQVKFSGGIGEMRGSIGGTVFARNKAGAYARNRTKPINPNTARQVNARQIMAELAEQFNGTLTDVQRTAWNLFGANVPVLNKLGETIRNSGFDWFVAMNSSRINAGMSIVVDAPTTFELAEQDNTIAISISAATQQASVTFDNTKGWATEAGGALLAYVGRPQLASRSFFNGPIRYTGKISGATPVAPTSPATINLNYVVTAGQKVWMQFRVVRADGRISNPFWAQAVVGA